MAKKKGNTKKGASNPTSGPQDSITLRQEITGKIKPKVPNNVKVYLNHLENLATWASGQPSIPSLAAFFGQRLAAAAESLAVTPDASLFLCQRCETILQPGSNCSVRIEKNNVKRCRRRNKSSNLTQNVVVYYCHYCSCRNRKRGTPKGHMKGLYDTKFVSKVKSVDVKDGKQCENESLTMDVPKILPSTTRDSLTIDTPPTEDIPTVDAPATPPTMTGMTLLNLKRRKRKKPSSKNQTEPESCLASTADGDKTEGTSKRKRNRKSWASLKEIAKRNEESGKQNVAVLAIPFSL